MSNKLITLKRKIQQEIESKNKDPERMHELENETQELYREIMGQSCMLKTPDYANMLFVLDRVIPETLHERDFPKKRTYGA